MKNHRQLMRSQRGILGYVLLLSMIPTCFGVAALAGDFGHGVLLRSQLQSACDAAALAGAQDLIGVAGQPTTAQQTLVQTDATAIAQANFADNQPVSVSFTSPVVTYNSSYSSTVPMYSIQVTTTQSTNNIFARVLGALTIPVSATSRAGVFQTSSTEYGKLGQVNFALGAAIDVGANNQYDNGNMLDQLSAGQYFELTSDGQTAGGTKNSAWIELSDGQTASPLSPLATTQTPTTQWAAQTSPGLVTTGSGSSVAYAAYADSGGNNTSTNGTTGWTQWVYNQIEASTSSPKSCQVTMLALSAPTGNTNASAMAQGTEVQAVGVVTFNIIQTSIGPGGNLTHNASFYGYLVNALPLDANAASTWSSFFGKFDQSGSNSGTAKLRLY